MGIDRQGHCSSVTLYDCFLRIQLWCNVIHGVVEKRSSISELRTIVIDISAIKLLQLYIIF